MTLLNVYIKEYVTKDSNEQQTMIWQDNDNHTEFAINERYPHIIFITLSCTTNSNMIFTYYNYHNSTFYATETQPLHPASSLVFRKHEFMGKVTQMRATKKHLLRCCASLPTPLTKEIHRI